MINSECKKGLLERVKKFADNKDLWNTPDNGYGRKNDQDLGSSNIRSVANICENADCYEEFKLYIKYKIAKGNGWDKIFKNNMNFGQVVLKDMDEIYIEAGKDDEEALRRISLYFGYLYWEKSSIEKSNKTKGRF